MTDHCLTQAAACGSCARRFENCQDGVHLLAKQRLVPNWLDVSAESLHREFGVQFHLLGRSSKELHHTVWEHSTVPLLLLPQ